MMAGGDWQRRSAAESVEETASTASVMRVMNERAVFERIRLLGPVSRPQLAEATGLSKPTISLALADLERCGLVRHVGQRTGNSGRAALLYEMRPEAGWVIGVDVGRSWLRVALANLAGVLVENWNRHAKKPKQNILGHGSDLGCNPERVGARMMSPPMENWNV